MPSSVSAMTPGHPVYAGWDDLAIYNGLSAGFIPTTHTAGQGMYNLASTSSSGDITLPNIHQGFNMPAPPPPIVAPPSVTHVYWPLAPGTQQTTDFWMKACVVQRRTLYGCTWPACTDAELMTKTKARKHVHKHLGLEKLYKCSCGVQFGSLESAKRHSNTQATGKTYPCQFCFKHFARKDHRGAHQKKCGSHTSV